MDAAPGGWQGPPRRERDVMMQRTGPGICRRGEAAHDRAPRAAGGTRSGSPRGPGSPDAGGAQIRRNDLDALALPVKQDDTVARGYRRDVLVRWGDRVTFDAPAWDPRRPDPEGAAAQFGWDARVAAIAVPTQQAADGVPRAVLAWLHPRWTRPSPSPAGGTSRPRRRRCRAPPC